MRRIKQTYARTKCLGGGNCRNARNNGKNTCCRDVARIRMIGLLNTGHTRNVIQNGQAFKITSRTVCRYTGSRNYVPLNAAKHQTYQPASMPDFGCSPDFILNIQTIMFQILAHGPIASWVQPCLARRWCVHFPSNLRIREADGMPHCSESIIPPQIAS